MSIASWTYGKHVITTPLRLSEITDSKGGLGRPDLERLSREELIELVLRLQRPAKTLRTSSKPPSTDRRERRDALQPGGEKSVHEGHSRILSEAFDRAIDHRPDTFTGCCAALPADLATETVSAHDTVELPPITPVVERHRPLAVRCPRAGCA
jgi:transposase